MIMNRPRKRGVPATGDGVTSGKKPAKTQISQSTKSGTVLSKATAALWGVKSGKKKK